MKLSKAQLAILRRLADGDILDGVSGRHSHAFWHRQVPGERAPSTATIWALEKRGLIERYDVGPSGSRKRLTDAGRKALSEQEPSP